MSNASTIVKSRGAEGARLLRPRSIAVVGAGQRAGSIGHEVFVNLIRHGFNGPVYPMIPEHSSGAACESSYRFGSAYTKSSCAVAYSA